MMSDKVPLDPQEKALPFIDRLAVTSSNSFFDKLYLGYHIWKILFGINCTLRQRLDCFNFYFNTQKNSCLMATLPRSGYHWINLMLRVAFDFENGGKGEYVLVDNKWIINDLVNTKIFAPLDWRIPLQERWHTSPFFFHTNRPYYKVPCMAKSTMRTIIIVRNIWDQQKSVFYDYGFSEETEPLFKKSGHLERAIGFYNSWGEFQEKHPQNFRVLYYEDFLPEPYVQLKKLVEFFGFQLSETSLQKAIENCSKEGMAKRIQENSGQPNQSKVTLHKRKDPFSAETIEYIANTVQQKLRYSLSHDHLGTKNHP